MTSEIDKLKHFDWKECRCLKGVKLEDVTPELEQKAFEEMK